MKTNKSILSSETEDILMHFGIQLGVIRKVQHAYIKEELIARLEKLTNYIKNDEYGEALAMFTIAPVQDIKKPNYLLNCDDIFPLSEGVRDIHHVISKLSDLLYIISEEPL